jgi:hypothetical protein
MTKKQQRIAIAKACGWKHEFNGDHEYPEWYWIPPDDPDGSGEPPDYLADLNAMHKAEKVLNDEWLEYMLNLMGVCHQHPDSGKWTCVQVCMSATAPQRAEAFLKTLNLWNDNE